MEMKKLSWPDDEAAICNLIEKERAALKIVTKMKNETYFAEKWIQHHAKILGNTKLIVFDNMSTERSVFDIYQKYKDNIILISFDMYMDCIHMASNFFSLYQYLAKSAKYFTIIDADEFLYLYDQGKLISDDSISRYLCKADKVDFFAPLWLQNIENMDSNFNIDKSSLLLVNGSKPIVNSAIVKTIGTSFLNGNFSLLHHVGNLPMADYKQTQTKFLLLHMKNINLYVRIRSDMQKLVALGIVKNVGDYGSLLMAHNNSTETGHEKSYINETVRLINKIVGCEHDAVNEDNILKIAAGGELSFSCCKTKSFFEYLINADYLDLIGYDYKKGINSQCKTIDEFLNLSDHCLR